MVNIKRNTARQIARMARLASFNLTTSTISAYNAMRSAPRDLQIKAAYKAALMDDSTVTDHVVMPSDNKVGLLSLYMY